MKLLAVPGPAPGPCEAKAALVHNEQLRFNAVHVSAIARCRALDVVMTVSCDEKSPEDTGDSLRWFCGRRRKLSPLFSRAGRSDRTSDEWMRVLKKQSTRRGALCIQTGDQHRAQSQFLNFQD